jgi:NADH dehydrogenase [ubiquinone] 1 alpha subcomplex assembly factor 7
MLAHKDIARPLPSLADRLKLRIAREGPLPVANYMEACLTDARSGYYKSHQPIGKEGDFITSPEISQIFGELLGLWSVAVWQSMGEPASVILCELGPGRGTLMEDALRAMKNVPQFVKAASVALVETSPVLRGAQAATLRAAPVPIAWYCTVEELPKGPLILLANEFLDALPIRQLVRRGDEWRERSVGLDEAGRFVFTENDTVSGPPPEIVARAEQGAILEIRPAVARLVSALAARAAPVAALFIDYGHDETGLGDTLQAVRAHRFADPLEGPGEADLSAHVDFADLARRAKASGVKSYGPLGQGAFLLGLGLEARRDCLLQQATPEQKQAIASGAARLVDPTQMGILFKALALTGGAVPPPPPFPEVV